MTEPPNTRSKACSGCGSRNRPDARFCRTCGKELVSRVNVSPGRKADRFGGRSIGLAAGTLCIILGVLLTLDLLGLMWPLLFIFVGAALVVYGRRRKGLNG